MDEDNQTQSFTINADGEMRIGRINGRNGTSKGCTLNFLVAFIHQSETASFLENRKRKYELGNYSSSRSSSRSRRAKMEASLWDEFPAGSPSSRIVCWDDVPRCPLPGSFSPMYTPAETSYSNTYDVKSPAYEPGTPSLPAPSSSVYRPVAYSPSSPGYFDNDKGPSSPLYAPGSRWFVPDSPRWSPAASPEYSPTSPFYSPSSPKYSPVSPKYSTAYSPIHKSPDCSSHYSPSSPKYSPCQGTAPFSPSMDE